MTTVRGARGALGRFGEDQAVRHLEEVGLGVLDRNWRCRWGEIDVVARDGGTLVFAEVKIRSGAGFGSAAESVTAAKVRRLRRLAACWLAAHPGEHGTVRFDVVAITRSRAGLAVDHLVAAF